MSGTFFVSRPEDSRAQRGEIFSRARGPRARVSLNVAAGSRPLLIGSLEPSEAHEAARAGSLSRQGPDPPGVAWNGLSRALHISGSCGSRNGPIRGQFAAVSRPCLSRS